VGGHPRRCGAPKQDDVVAAQAGKVLPLLARFFERHFQTKPFQRLLSLLMGCGGQVEERGDPRLILVKCSEPRFNQPAPPEVIGVKTPLSRPDPLLAPESPHSLPV
jgi:hypothetical protein